MSAASAPDPIDLARALIRCDSVTPREAGALDALEAALAPLGFTFRRLKFDDVDNLYARLGTGAPNFCFAGHVDVVPPGDEAAWTHPPFGADIAPGPDGAETLWGRGARDMKGAVAAFAAAVESYLAECGSPPGSISFLITCDEEGPARNGTKAVLPALADSGKIPDHVLVGEPTNPHTLGEMIKIGRRGSLNAHLTVTGKQGHVAYPQDAANPVPVLLDLLDRLRRRELDAGYESFLPSNLEISSVDVGNPATNVIPARAEARFNIRFNPSHTGAQLTDWIEAERAAVAEGFSGSVAADIHVSGEPFLTTASDFTGLIAEAVRAETGRAPDMSTTGGTSDARFIQAYAPVCEFGLVGETIHQVDEHAPVEEIRALARIYRRVLDLYFARFAEAAR